MTRGRAFRWAAIFTLGVGVAMGATALLGALHQPEPARVTNAASPPPESDPWFVRYAALILLVGGSVFGWYIKAKIIDPAKAATIAESSTRKLAIQDISAVFKEAIGEMRGTVVGLQTGVEGLGRAITSIADAARDVSKTAAAVSEKSAVAMAKIEALGDRVARVEGLSHSVQEDRR